MNARVRLRLAQPIAEQSLVRHAAAAAYNQAGDAYIVYADGDAGRLFSFDGHYAYADRRVWSLIQAKLAERLKSGARTIRILDAGCGPGTWLRRVVAHANALGFTAITARGFDVAEAQIRRARTLARDVSGLPGVDLTFDVGDIAAPLSEEDTSVDLFLCLYGVLNHFPTSRHQAIVAEIERVLAGHFVTTVRTIGSMPTVYVDSVEKAREFRQDNEHDRCEVEFCDGRHIAFDSHLFAADELCSLVGGPLAIDDLRGLDLFHSRFAPDRRWNPASLEASDQLREELICLEETFSTDPNFIDRATHLLLVARRRPILPRRSRKH